MIHVYLDDFRYCPEGFVLAKNAEECKLLIDHEQIDILSLDYDLGWNEPTGYEVVQHLMKTGKFPRSIYLHTSSIYGRQQMYDALRQRVSASYELYARPMTKEELEEVLKRKQAKEEHYE